MAQLDNVFVVEDEEEWRGIYLRNLPRHGGRNIRVAKTLVEAETALNEMAFAVAFVDIGLDEHDQSNVDGLRVMERILQLEDHTSVVMVTGKGTLQITRDALKKYRAFDAFDKSSIDPEDIIRVLDSATDAYVDSVSTGRRNVVRDLFRGNLEPLDWEDQMIRATRVRSGAATLHGFLDKLFGKFLPAVPKHPGLHVRISSPDLVAHGAYWSRGAGKPVLVCFGHQDDVGAILNGDDGDSSFLKEYIRAGVLHRHSSANIRGAVFELSNLPRMSFQG